MKKLLLLSMLLLGASATLLADNVEDTQFRQYVELTRKSLTNPAGMTVASDSTYRIIYVAMPMAISSSDVTPEIMKSMKNIMLAAMRKETADCAVIKDLKISIVYSFITSDKHIFTTTITFNDL
ncbi:MAG: hypothetical protein E7057_00510 [Lentisphaerae bacterium]|nr:hypothetical protein [Lentisphaerota bacterium]